MQETLFFYDLETTGRNKAADRIMQFAGQRTDQDLNPIGEAVNCLIRITPDILPEPGAVLLHGIAPQQTLEEGFTEAEFLTQFYDRVVSPGTVFVGFNNITFDDEFMRYINYRNLYDPYAWQYDQNCSRWDILPLVRFTRALRPKGINWPQDGNRLTDLTEANQLTHDHAHDALSDVLATIAVAKMIKGSQPELYDYMYRTRKKHQVIKLASTGQPFVYTDIFYPADKLYTTVAMKVAEGHETNRLMIYDLRHDPESWVKRSPDELAAAWGRNPDRPTDAPVLPVNFLQLNRCPAIAPLGVLKISDQKRLDLDLETIKRHNRFLLDHQQEFAEKLRRAEALLPAKITPAVDRPVDERLYDGFLQDSDKHLLRSLVRDDPDAIREAGQQFQDERLRQLATLYIARNLSAGLTGAEHDAWERYRIQRLLAGGNESRMAKFMRSLEEEAAKPLSPKQRLLLEDLRLYAESLIPSDM